MDDRTFHRLTTLLICATSALAALPVARTAWRDLRPRIRRPGQRRPVNPPGWDAAVRELHRDMRLLEASPWG